MKMMIDIFKVQQIVRKAARFFTDDKLVQQIKEKGAFDFVTAVDENVQQFIKKELEAIYPEIQFLGEEDQEEVTGWNGLVWVLDPVDGTTNLIHGYCNSAISLGLLEKREVIAGIIYDPYLDEMYWAQKGKGSYLNGKPIYVSNAKTMNDSLISIGTSPYQKSEALKNFEIFQNIFMDCQDIRRNGAAALEMAHVACGRIEGYFEKTLKIWDYAAGTIIIREAGGKVLDYSGAERSMQMSGDVVAGNAFIASVLVEKYLK